MASKLPQELIDQIWDNLSESDRGPRANFTITHKDGMVWLFIVYINGDCVAQKMEWDTAAFIGTRLLYNAQFALADTDLAREEAYNKLSLYLEDLRRRDLEAAE